MNANDPAHAVHEHQSEQLQSSAQRRQPIRASVLLTGGITAPEVARASRTPLLDLNLSPRRTLLQWWIDRIRQLSPDEPPEIRIAAGTTSSQSRSNEQVRSIPDSQSYRGPAGAMKDACIDLHPDDIVLVVEANRFPGSDLARVVESHHRRQAGVTVVANPDDSPAGMYLLRAEMLEHVPSRGFMDIKEQWLHRCAAQKDSVWVHRLEAPGTMHLSGLAEFLAAARVAVQIETALSDSASRNGDLLHLSHHHGVSRTATVQEAVWVGQGAEVLPDSRVDGSVIMSGARIAAGSVVVRSLVCPETEIAAGAEVVDAIATRQAIIRAQPAA